MAPFVNGLAAGYGIAIPVGAIAVLIVDTGSRWGFGAARAGLGAALADLTYASIAVLVGASVAHVLDAHADAIRWASAAVLLAIALFNGARALRSSDAAARPLGPRSPRMVLTFLGLTLANPLTVTYFAALVVGQTHRLDAPGAALFVAGAFLASLSWQTFLAATGAALGHALPDGSRRWTGLGGSIVVAVLAVRVAVGT